MKFSIWRSEAFIFGLLYSLLPLLTLCLVRYFIVISEDDLLIQESKTAIESQLKYLSLLSQENLDREIDLLIKDKSNSFVLSKKDIESSQQKGHQLNWPQRIHQNTFFELEVPFESLNLITKSKRAGSEHYDVLAKISRLSDGQFLLVGRNIDDLEITQWVANTFGWLLITILGGMAFLSMLLGYLWMRRLTSITRIARGIIQTQDLTQRIPRQGRWSDVGQLVDILNLMLGRIEALVQEVSTVTDNIAHNLRTPLTRLKAEIELCEEPTRRQVLHRETDHLLNMFNGLLRLAKLEGKSGHHGEQIFKLHELLEDVYALYEPLAEEKNISFDFKYDEVNMTGDQDLTFQLFSNLLDNALKYTPENGSIELLLETNNSKAVVTLSDTGPGIPKEEFKQVLEKFGRLKRDSSKAGYGLGLSMVQAITNYHNWELRFIETKIGLEIQIHFSNLKAISE